MAKFKKLVQLKDYSGKRLSKNPVAVRKLLKKRGYLFRAPSDNSFHGNLMFNQFNGIHVDFKDLVTGARMEVRKIKYGKSTNTFYIGNDYI